MKTLWLAILLLSNAPAFADITLAKPFVWNGTGDFSFGVSDLTMTADFGGSLSPDGQASPPNQGIFHVDVRAYGRSNVALLLSESDNGVGAIYLLSGRDFTSTKPILVRRVSMKSYFDGVISRLRELGYENPLEPLRAYFKKNPSARFEAYVHELDANLVESRNLEPREEPQVVQRQAPSPQQSGEVDPQPDERQTPGEQISPEEQARQDRQAQIDQQQREYEQEVRQKQKEKRRQQQEAYCQYYGGRYCNYYQQRAPRQYQYSYPGQGFFEGLFGRPD